MPIIQLHIQGLTHHDIAARREQFVSTAVGRRIALRAARLCEDGRTVEAYVGGECVGVVARLDRDLAVGALRTEEKGGVLHGRIVEARDYVLLAEIKVTELPQVEAPASVLRDWKYSGPLLAERAEERKLAFLEEELTALLTEDTDVDVEEVLELLQVFCRTAPYDISAEGLELRRQLVQWLSAAEDAHLREAAELVREMSQRMGGDTWMAQLGEWMKAELPTSREALTMEVEAAALAEVRAEAERLPQGLMALWRSDMAQFVRVLYGMLPTREKLRRVLSCLVVLELTDGAPACEVQGTEEEFLKEFVRETKDYYRHDRKRADDVRRILGNLGKREAKAELDAWINDKERTRTGLSDAQVAQALEAICGEGRALDTKQKWAGAYWCLRWYCNFPVKGSDFCEKIATLPFTKPLNPECSYNNIRRIVTLSFMNQDARQLNAVKPSRQDEKVFAECRTIVTALAQELGKMANPQT